LSQRTAAPRTKVPTSLSPAAGRNDAIQTRLLGARPPSVGISRIFSSSELPNRGARLGRRRGLPVSSSVIWSRVLSAASVRFACGGLVRTPSELPHYCQPQHSWRLGVKIQPRDPGVGWASFLLEASVSLRSRTATVHSGRLVHCLSKTSTFVVRGASLTLSSSFAR